MLISVAFLQGFDPSETEYHKAPSYPPLCSTFFSTTSQLPPHKDDTKILSYADYITITSTHAKNNTAVTNAQHYLNTLQTWLTINRLEVAPEKSTATLIINYKQEYNHNNSTTVTLHNTLIP